MTRFRIHKYAFTADIEKMYRQILIDSEQRDFLRILWSNPSIENPATYQLNTISYGTASAPFLAIRTLKQLALDEAVNFPLASKIILRDMYMDDIVSGASDLETAKELQYQLVSALQSGGMNLHKWTSNSSELFNSSSNKNDDDTFSLDRHSTVKALGLNWHPHADYLFFKVNLNEETIYTKKGVLSVIARLYDPIGLLGPIISKAKIFMQKLWLQNLKWDDVLPEPLVHEWTQFVATLKCIENIKIERYLLSEPNDNLTLLGFADASEAAYASVVYIHSQGSSGIVKPRLIASKSRVAPIKVISIPRLELCACLLLAQLIEKVSHSLQLELKNIILHTDSTIALAWISTPPHKLKTFIGNRVSKIQSLTENYQWKHVPSYLNSADVLSRGIHPHELSETPLWWNCAPECLQEGKNFNAETDTSIHSNEHYFSELKKDSYTTLVNLTHSSFLEQFLNMSNNYYKLIRIFSFICRFLHNCKRPKEQRREGPLSDEEIKFAKLKLIKLIQVVCFYQEIKSLKDKKNLKRGQVSNLNPFLDDNDVIRVGGRLRHSSVSYDKKYPILLPKGHKFTLFVMNYYHLKYLHAGAQTLLYLVRQEFWPLGGRNTARKVVHSCITCFKAKPKVMEQIMGDLPSQRVNPSLPFTHVGIDFCGPFHIKYNLSRRASLHKIYVAIFICLSTRAVHLELVSDLTSYSFIASLKRFISRRGKCVAIYSDNARNFIGANNELKRLHNLVKKPDDILANYLSSEEINWTFIPPRAPHFGGLWEAGVKSFKFHLKRAVGSSRFTYEEFLTITNQIEGILNSRPITPSTNDANDLEALSPAHFLIGRPVTSLPEPDLTNLSDNYIKRWQRTTKATQYLWKRWHIDYLSHCQQRTKWQFVKENILKGTMVLIKEENLPSTSWLLGRVVEVICGADQKVRVCVVKTQSGILKRPISKLAVLPIE